MWNDERSKLLTAILDQIIPASDDGHMPAAGALGVSKFIEQEIRINSALFPVFERGLERVTELSAVGVAEFSQLSDAQKVALLKQLEGEDSEFFQALIRLTYMGYYSRPDIRALLNLSAKPVHPDGYHVEREPPELMSELTRPVVERGPVYRA